MKHFATQPFDHSAIFTKYFDMLRCHGVGGLVVCVGMGGTIN
ncbi:hypothetical protein ACSF6V_11340 [Escherichia coli]